MSQVSHLISNFCAFQEIKEPESNFIQKIIEFESDLHNS